ncbi:hypothetical protein L1887_38910 [Cichorium endivia]|nr:hypothetical protein L1887_38910 [Cichorium endivia]
MLIVYSIWFLTYSIQSENEQAHGDSKLSCKGNNRNTSLKVFKFANIKRATRNFSQDLPGNRCPGNVFLGWVDKNTFAPSREGVGIAVAVKTYNEDPLREWQA